MQLLSAQILPPLFAEIVTVVSFFARKSIVSVLTCAIAVVKTLDPIVHNNIPSCFFTDRQEDVFCQSIDNGIAR